MNIYIICPVQNLIPEWRKYLEDFAETFESYGHKVHLPFRDVDQADPTGLRVCNENAVALKNADIVYAAFDGKSRGCLFDLGMAFVLGKKIVPIGNFFPPKTTGKSIENVGDYIHN
jgi:nucleoside 2-deoxyribosyltransferase